MARWRHRLDFRPFWNDDSLIIQEKAKRASEAIEKTFPLYLTPENEDFDMDLDMINDYFKGVAEDPLANADDFDEVIEQLYDWGDQEVKPFGEWPRNKMCWIATNF